MPSVSWIKVSNDEHRVGKILNSLALVEMMLEFTHVKQVIDVERTLGLNLSMCSVSIRFCTLGKF